MLKIYRGRESCDKEGFMYSLIKNAPRGPRQGRSLVIVPDQYTLAAERKALRYLQSEVLLDVEITSMSRLGQRLLDIAGPGREAAGRTFIDRYGRHMLLSRILREKAPELTMFGAFARRESFIEEVNDFISQAKQYGVRAQDLELLFEPEAGGPGTGAGVGEKLLSGKLADLRKIYAAYEEALEGRYTDSEDLIDLYTEKIASFSALQDDSVYLYGFDSFTPRNLGIVRALIRAARDVTVFLTFDEGCPDEELFDLTRVVTERLAACAREAGSGVEIRDIKASDPDVRGFPDKAPGIRSIERELYAARRERQSDAGGLRLVKAANMYSEAENAASYILALLRDEGLRLRDIVVICNDMEVRGPIIARVFEEYGLEVFADRKRPIMSSPVAVYISGLVALKAGRYGSSDLFRVLKTGLTPISMDEVEELENYSVKYRVRGAAWKRAFTRGAFEYGDEGLARIEDIRRRTMACLAPFEEICRKSATVGDFIRSFYGWLAGDSGLAARIGGLAEAQRAAGLEDRAEETVQVWDMLMQAFGQLAELMADEPFDVREFALLLESGLSQMEVGVIPPTADEILMGTMQRTRAGDVRAMLVLGANEGVLPMEPAEGTLFSPEELELIASGGHEICKDNGLRAMEEALAIYRNLSKPSEHLYISYSVSDGQGESLRESGIVTRIRDIFPNLEEEPDAVSRGDAGALIGGKLNTLRHYTEALREARRGDRIDPRWDAVREWLEETDEPGLERIRRGLSFTNRQAPLPRGLALGLLEREDGSLSFSPSRLESFSRCPFSHFVAYGLVPDERRLYEAAGREIGDLYHLVLMRLSRELTHEGRWQSINREESDLLVDRLIKSVEESYREGLFDAGGGERYRGERAGRACREVAWTLISQMRSGAVEQSLFEQRFGRGCELAPIVQETSAGTVYIEGKIDRLDILPGNRVKIIDYKTGRERFSKREAEAGYRLQLMVYLKAARGERRRPAGVFYFLIGEPQADVSGVSADKISEKISDEVKNFFKLDGIMVNDADVIAGIAGDFEDDSEVVPLKRRRDGAVWSRRKDFLLTEDEFAGLEQKVDRQVARICEEIVSGRIDIRPMRAGNAAACTFCRYKGICRFDTAFPGCEYEVIR